MIPFFAPFTAPDGSTRRPIVERVPECRPQSVGYMKDGRWTTENGATITIVPHPMMSHLFTCHVSIASDLCCMACIRWVAQFQYVGKVKDGINGARWFCWSRYLDVKKAKNYPSYSDAHALNALAHAVADELGIEK